MRDFSNITPGTKLFVHVGNYGGFHITTVEKVHKKYFVDSRGYEWNLSNGSRRGGDRWTNQYFELYDPNDQAQQLLITKKRQSDLRDRIQYLLPKVTDEARLIAALGALETKDDR